MQALEVFILFAAGVHSPLNKFKEDGNEISTMYEYDADKLAGEHHGSNILGTIPYVKNDHGHPRINYDAGPGIDVYRDVEIF